jgi:hypothetical protein
MRIFDNSMAPLTGGHALPNRTQEDDQNRTHKGRINGPAGSTGDLTMATSNTAKLVSATRQLEESVGKFGRLPICSLASLYRKTFPTAKLVPTTSYGAYNVPRARMILALTREAVYSFARSVKTSVRVA